MTTIDSGAGANTAPGRVTERQLIQAQIIAGTLFAAFVLLHLSNIILAPFGPEVFNTYQRAIRPVYQHPVIEILLVLGPLVTHAIAGVWLMVKRRGQRRTGNPWTRINRWAGLFLLVVIVGHVAATRGASFFYDVYPEFEGLSFSLWFVPAYFYPYYFLLGVAGFYHASSGLIRLARRFGIQVPRAAHLAAVGTVGVLVMLSLLAFGGHLFDIADPTANAYARLTMKLTGTSF